MREELPNERREMASKRNKNREELPNERREMTSKQNKDREELLQMIMLKVQYIQYYILL